jgi:hypothetical protein
MNLLTCSSVTFQLDRISLHVPHIPCKSSFLYALDIHLMQIKINIILSWTYATEIGSKNINNSNLE